MFLVMGALQEALREAYREAVTEQECRSLPYHLQRNSRVDQDPLLRAMIDLSHRDRLTISISRTAMTIEAASIPKWDLTEALLEKRASHRRDRCRVAVMEVLRMASQAVAAMATEADSAADHEVPREADSEVVEDRLEVAGKAGKKASTRACSSIELLRKNWTLMAMSSFLSIFIQSSIPSWILLSMTS